MACLQLDEKNRDAQCGEAVYVKRERRGGFSGARFLFRILAGGASIRRARPRLPCVARINNSRRWRFRLTVFAFLRPRWRRGCRPAFVSGRRCRFPCFFRLGLGMLFTVEFGEGNFSGARFLFRIPAGGASIRRARPRLPCVARINNSHRWRFRLTVFAFLRPRWRRGCRPAFVSGRGRLGRRCRFLCFFRLGLGKLIWGFLGWRVMRFPRWWAMRFLRSFFYPF